MSITRRDFLNGVALLAAGSALPSWAAALLDAPYPPGLTGLRGAHEGAFEAAHALAFGGDRNFGALAAPAEQFDLVVVGAGISGLAAAYFYRKRQPKARVLILDNHDDFGGHAKRNEFTIDGKTLISYGGAQAFESPTAYSKISQQLLQELGVDLAALSEAYDDQLFGGLKLSLGVFYDRAGFGSDTLLRSNPPTRLSPSYYTRQMVPGIQAAPAFAETLLQAPLKPPLRAQLQAILAGSPKAKSWFAGAKGKQRFFKARYVDFLRAVYGVQDPALLALLSMPLAEDAALGGTGVSIPLALSGGLLGLPPASFFKAWLDEELEEADDDDEAYRYHFPDGNATLARLLVHKLIPSVASFSSAAESVSARFDYRQLDQAEQAVKLRLKSMAVQLENQGKGVRVRYLREGKLYEAQAAGAVMAGWHMLAAHIIPSLPQKQKEAMRANIKMPLVYAQIALRQWQPVADSGVISAYCPNSYFQFTVPDFPVSMGAYQPSRTPDAPMVLLMIRMPCPLQGEGSVPDLLRAGRADLLGTSFETFEQQIRQQLDAMYGPYGFNSSRDIAAITVNRWPHGYVWDEAEYQGQPAHLLARQKHGRIAMANADSAGKAYVDAAIDMAWRAVGELLPK